MGDQKEKLSYAWVRSTPLFKSVSTGMTFDEKHKLAVDLMVEYLNNPTINFKAVDISDALLWEGSHLGEDKWCDWWRRT